MEKQDIKTVPINTKTNRIVIASIDDIDSDVSTLLESNSYYNSNVVRCVKFIKTVSNLDSFYIIFEDDYNKEYVCYINGELNIYSHSSTNGNYELTFKNGKIDIKAKDGSTLGNYEIVEFLKTCKKLESVQPSKIGKTEQKLIDDYRMLFNEEPDLNSTNTRDRIQKIACNNGVAHPWIKHNYVIDDIVNKLRILKK